MLEFQQFQERIRSELRARMKFSRDLLDLRDREAKLVKVKRYEEAEKIKMKADLLEEFERNKLEAEMQTVLQKKEAKLRHAVAGSRCSAQANLARSERAAEAPTTGLAASDPTQQEHPERPAEQTDR